MAGSSESWAKVEGDQVERKIKSKDLPEAGANSGKLGSGWPIRELGAVEELSGLLEKFIESGNQIKGILRK